MMEPDELHVRLRHFAKHVLGTRPYKYGNDDFNLTPSPWIGSFDVLTADAPAELRNTYRLVVCFDEEQARRIASSGQFLIVYTGKDDDARKCVARLEGISGCHVEGEVGCVRAFTTEMKGLIGLFNNSGVSKRNGKETTDPKAMQRVVVHGVPADTQLVVGSKFISKRDAGSVELALPAGEVVVLLLPDGRCLSQAN
jgi:hypothetical protein